MLILSMILYLYGQTQIEQLAGEQSDFGAHAVGTIVWALFGKMTLKSSCLSLSENDGSQWCQLHCPQRWINHDYGPGLKERWPAVMSGTRLQTLRLQLRR